MRSPEADNRVQLLCHGLKVSLGLHHDRARRAHGGTSERGRSERRDSKHVELRAMTVLRARNGGRRQTLNRGFRITLRLVVCPGRATLWISEAVLDGQKSKRLDGHASVPRGRVRMLALANERIRIMKVIFDDTRCRHCCHTFRIPDFGVSVTSVLQPCSGLIICVEFHRFTVTLTVTHILLPLHALGALVITSLVVVHGPSNQSRAQPGRGGWPVSFACRV